MMTFFVYGMQGMQGMMDGKVILLSGERQQVVGRTWLKYKAERANEGRVQKETKKGKSKDCRTNYGLGR